MTETGRRSAVHVPNVNSVPKEVLNVGTDVWLVWHCRPLPCVGVGVHTLSD
jgi:hypothetical protein